MKFLTFIAFLFLIYESSVYLVLGQTVNKEKNDCTKFYNYLNNDSNDYDKNSCCKESGIECDNDGYIIKISNYKPKNGYPDFSSFPTFSKIEHLAIMEVSIKEIPNSILKLSTLKNLIFYESNLEIIPQAIQNLSNLEELRIQRNYVKELPNEMFNLSNLKSLNLIGNYIEVIPPAIQNLSKLEEFLFNSNDLKELPNEIFNLPNLKKIYLGDNPYLKMEVTKFGNSTLELCDLEDVNIMCYEPGTCENISFGTREINNDEAVKVFQICSEEILSQKGIKNNSNQNDNKKSNSLIIVIIVCVIVNLIGVAISILLIKKKRSKKHRKSNTDDNDEFRTGSVKVILNNNRQSNVNSYSPNVEGNVINSYNPNVEGNVVNAYNPNVEVNNNNNNNNNRNSITYDKIHNTQNILNRNNFNQNNFNPNVMVNSNSGNSNIIPVRVVYVDNPYNYGMNANNNNGTTLFSTSVDEINDPPPEYTEI